MSNGEVALAKDDQLTPCHLSRTLHQPSGVLARSDTRDIDPISRSIRGTEHVLTQYIDHFKIVETLSENTIDMK